MYKWITEHTIPVCPAAAHIVLFWLCKVTLELGNLKIKYCYRDTRLDCKSSRVLDIVIS